MSNTKCVLADRACPETADQTKPRYCPAWVDAIPEVQRDGSGRLVAEEIYRGCFLRRLPLYLVGVTASAGQAAASADVCRNTVENALAPAARLVSAVLSSGARPAPLELNGAPE